MTQSTNQFNHVDPPILVRSTGQPRKQNGGAKQRIHKGAMKP